LNRPPYIRRMLIRIPTYQCPFILCTYLGTGVKIASATAHFHGFGVAQQGPWVTWVNKG
jgi:hypothetical protein